MLKYGANAFIWIDDWTTEKGDFAIEEAGKVGFDFIEIPLMRPWDFDPKPHREALSQAHIGATASVILPQDAHMPMYPDRAKEFLFAVLEKLDAVGGTYLCGCIAFAGGVFTGHPPTKGERQVVIDTLGEVVLAAKKRGITIGLECVNRYETYMYNVLEDAYATIKAVNLENFELHADTYHMNIEENNFYDPIVKCADILGYLHMSENHRGLIGTGTVNWEELFKGLADACYSGPLVLESFSENNPDLIAAIRLWRPPQESSDYLAREGLKFLQNMSAQYGL